MRSFNWARCPCFPAMSKTVPELSETGNHQIKPAGKVYGHELPRKRRSQHRVYVSRLASDLSFRARSTERARNDNSLIGCEISNPQGHRSMIGTSVNTISKMGNRRQFRFPPR